MVTNFSTIGGVVTKGETFSLLLHHLDMARDQMLVMSHLHKTEDSNKDDLRAKGWAAMAEMHKLIRHKVVEMAKGSIQ